MKMTMALFSGGMGTQSVFIRIYFSTVEAIVSVAVFVVNHQRTLLVVVEAASLSATQVSLCLESRFRGSKRICQDCIKLTSCPARSHIGNDTISKSFEDYRSVHYLCRIGKKKHISKNSE